jgi:hypothetical protein
MSFHWCGNWVHDILHNFLVLLILLPAAIPMLGYLRRRALSKYKTMHAEDGHCCDEDH